VLDLVEDQRLREVVVGAFLQRLDRGGDGRIPGHHHDLDRLVELLDLPQEVEAAHVRHPDVGHGDVEDVGLHGLEGIVAGPGRRDLIAPMRQRFLQELKDRALVVDDQNACGFHILGRE
jgi:hypothetical protein